MSNDRPTRRRALPLHLRSEDLEIDLPESLRTSPELEGPVQPRAFASDKREDTESPTSPLWSPITPVVQSGLGRSETVGTARARRGADERLTTGCCELPQQGSPVR